MEIDKEKLLKTIKNSLGGADIKSGKEEEILNLLSEKDKESILKVLNDKAALKSILNTKEAAEILERFKK